MVFPKTLVRLRSSFKEISYEIISFYLVYLTSGIYYFQCPCIGLHTVRVRPRMSVPRYFDYDVSSAWRRCA